MEGPTKLNSFSFAVDRKTMAHRRRNSRCGPLEQNAKLEWHHTCHHDVKLRLGSKIQLHILLHLLVYISLQRQDFPKKDVVVWIGRGVLDSKQQVTSTRLHQYRPLPVDRRCLSEGMKNRSSQPLQQQRWFFNYFVFGDISMN